MLDLILASQIGVDIYWNIYNYFTPHTANNILFVDQYELVASLALEDFLFDYY
jgi:hypothetical protein